MFVMNHGSDRERVTSLSTLHTLKHVAIYAYRLRQFYKTAHEFLKQCWAK